MKFLNLNGSPVLNEDRYAEIADSDVKTGTRLPNFFKNASYHMTHMVGWDAACSWKGHLGRTISWNEREVGKFGIKLARMKLERFGRSWKVT